jgi:multidrug efflux pump subunit AcrA (membrane-fusion protein)
MRGRVTYIDPRVDPQSRTAKVRVEVANAERRLKLGMYVTMAFSSPTGRRALMVPRAAIQNLGDRQVAFVPARDEPGKFLSRAVRLGPLERDAYPVLGGLEPGETVVTEGSFLLRAEALRNRP